MNGRVPSGCSPVSIFGALQRWGVEMRKRGDDGRFVSGPGVGAERVAVEVRKAKRLPTNPAAETFRRYTRTRVAEGYPTIVETFVRKAKAGSVSHARALATLSGLDKGEAAQKKPAARRGKTLGRRLIEELDKAKERAAAKAKKAAEAAARTEETATAEDGGAGSL